MAELIKKCLCELEQAFLRWLLRRVKSRYVVWQDYYKNLYELRKADAEREKARADKLLNERDSALGDMWRTHRKMERTKHYAQQLYYALAKMKEQSALDHAYAREQRELIVDLKKSLFDLSRELTATQHAETFEKLAEEGR